MTAKYTVDVFTPQSVYRRDEYGRGFPENTYEVGTPEDVAKIIKDVSTPRSGICKIEVWIGDPPEPLWADEE